MINIKIANIFKYASTSEKNGGGGDFFQTEGRDENQELEGKSQSNTQVAMPPDDIVVVGDNTTEEEQQSNSVSHCK